MKIRIDTRRNLGEYPYFFDTNSRQTCRFRFLGRAYSEPPNVAFALRNDASPAPFPAQRGHLLGGVSASSSKIQAPVARYDPDLRMVGKPSPHRRRSRDLEAGLRSAIFPDRTRLFRSGGSCESPVINADDDQRLRFRAASSPNNPQQSVVAHRQHQSLGEARCRPAAECQPQMVNDAFRPCRPARPGRENIVPELFSENPPPTMRYFANEPSRDHAEAYLLACTWQIRGSSGVLVMDSARSHPAHGRPN
jgi:hypothetical protein